MTRVIAGTAGGRRLSVPPGTGTRPTSDRAREGLFSTWESLLGGPLNGERVLDLYAGSGAVGLEALSRGAAHALLVEADATDPAATSNAVGSLRTLVESALYDDLKGPLAYLAGAPGPVELLEACAVSICRLSSGEYFSR